MSILVELRRARQASSDEDPGLASTLSPDNSGEQASASQFAAEKGAASVQKFPDGMNDKTPTGIVAVDRTVVDYNAATACTINGTLQQDNRTS